MSGGRHCLALSLGALLVVVTAAPAAADDPRDADIFGPSDDDPPAAPGTQPAATPAAPPIKEPRPPDLERRLLDIGTDKLQLGGLLFLRTSLAISDGDRVEDHRVSMPNLLDLYLDGRPNERLRAFVRGRLSWNPSVDPNSLQSQLSGAETVSVALDELWIKLDIGRRVFVTFGQQKVRWGTTRLWNPVDVINATRRPLLDPFDERLGVPLLKLHLPLESLGWNFYLAGVLDQVSSLDRAGVAGRAEFVFSTVELALTGAYRDGLDPRLGLDVSAGIWDLDFTCEVGLKFDDRFEHQVSVQAAFGLQYTISVFDKDMFIIGAEYFYNMEGSDTFNPLDLYQGKLQYFYVGRHYAALSAMLPRPGNLDDWTFTASVVGNMSDQSYIARFDVAVRVLTFLSLRLYLAGHLGGPGELVLGDALFPVAPVDLRSQARVLYSGDKDRPIPSQLFDLGLWLSMDL